MKTLPLAHGAAGDPPTGACAPHETGGGHLFPMKTKPMRYVRFGPHTQPAPNGRELAELYDKAAKQIELLYFALELCAPLTPRAEAARNAAFDAVREGMRS